MFWVFQDLLRFGRGVGALAVVLVWCTHTEAQTADLLICPTTKRAAPAEPSKARLSNSGLRHKRTTINDGPPKTACRSSSISEIVICARLGFAVRVKGSAKVFSGLTRSLFCRGCFNPLDFFCCRFQISTYIPQFFVSSFYFIHEFRVGNKL